MFQDFRSLESHGSPIACRGFHIKYHRIIYAMRVMPVMRFCSLSNVFQFGYEYGDLIQYTAITSNGFVIVQDLLDNVTDARRMNSCVSCSTRPVSRHNINGHNGLSSKATNLRKDIAIFFYRVFVAGNVASSVVRLTRQLLQNELNAAAYCIADSKAVVRYCWGFSKKYIIETCLILQNHNASSLFRAHGGTCPLYTPFNYRHIVEYLYVKTIERY